MKKSSILIAASILFSIFAHAQEPSPKIIHCYVGGTMRPVMEKLAEAYEKKTGVRLELDYGDSGTNMIKAENSGKGDLYVAHDPFHDVMQAKGLISKGWLAAYIHPVIVVKKGNPKKITGLASLKTPGLKVVLTDRIYSTMGYIVSGMLAKAGIEEEVEKNVVNRPRAGGEAANAVMLGHADAALVWNAVAFLRKKDLDVVEIEKDFRLKPGLDSVTGATYSVLKNDSRSTMQMPPIDLGNTKVTIDLLKSSAVPGLAENFAKFAVSSENEKAWKDFDFSIPGKEDKASFDLKAKGDSKQDVQEELFIYAGAGLQPAVSEIAETFSNETGIKAVCDFGGSGMILTRLKLAQRGDIFIPGDTWYVELAEKDKLISEKETVCYFIPVILVRKGNPKGIKDISDIARPGIRLGLGNPLSCQIGRLCEELIEKNKIDKTAVEKNLLFSSATVNELGIQMQTGHLDAAIVWDATAKFYSKDTEFIAIPAENNIVSTVAAAVLDFSKNKESAKTLIEFMRSKKGQDIFRRHGYSTGLEAADHK